MGRKIAVGVCIFVCVFAAVAQGAILLDKVMAIVNKEVITWSDLYRAMEFEATEEIKAMKDSDKRRFFKENETMFLESLIDMRLQLQEAAKAGISTSDEDVDKAIKNIKSKYSMTDEMFNEAIKNEKSSLPEYKKRLSEQITMSRVIEQEVRSKILVTEGEIDKYLSEHKELEKDNEGFAVSHIFLKKSQDDAQLAGKAKDIYKRIQSGGDFSELAKQYSEDSSAKSGGDLGFIRKIDMSQDFLKALSVLKTGDVSEPFWSGNGIHILKVNEIRVFKNSQELREVVKQKLMDEKFNREYRNWIKGLRERSYIEIKT
jgi:peptidyl-prolyl cis-trans isomerase SurA